MDSTTTAPRAPQPTLPERPAAPATRPLRRPPPVLSPGHPPGQLAFDFRRRG